MKQLRQNLLLQFSLASFVAMVVIAGVLSVLISRTLRNNVLDEAAHEARDTLSQRVTANLTTDDLTQGMQGARYTEFNRFIQESVVSERTARIKVWNREGMVVYSTDPQQVGQRFPMKPLLQEALSGGEGRSISVPNGVENERERLLGTLIEVYVPIQFKGTAAPTGSLEIYQYYAPFAGVINRQNRLVLTILPAGFLALYLSLVGLVGRGWLTMRRQHGQIQQRDKELTGLNALLRQHVSDLEQRQRELVGLNGLFRRLISQRASAMDEIQRIIEQTPVNAPTVEECEQCRSRLQKAANMVAELEPPPEGRV